MRLSKISPVSQSTKHWAKHGNTAVRETRITPALVKGYIFNARDTQGVIRLMTIALGIMV